jgi:hypothetical protein
MCVPVYCNYILSNYLVGLNYRKLIKNPSYKILQFVVLHEDWTAGFFIGVLTFNPLLEGRDFYNLRKTVWVFKFMIDVIFFLKLSLIIRFVFVFVIFFLELSLIIRFVFCFCYVFSWTFTNYSFCFDFDGMVIYSVCNYW